MVSSCASAAGARRAHRPRVELVEAHPATHGIQGRGHQAAVRALVPGEAPAVGPRSGGVAAWGYPPYGAGAFTNPCLHVPRAESPASSPSRS